MNIENEEIYLASSKFQSRDELLKGVRAFYWSKGYGLSIRNSRKDKFVLLKCNLGGSYRDTRDISDNRKRSTGTHLIECPFSIKGKNGGDGVWVFEAIDLTHNHEPSTDMSGHSSFRRLPPEKVQSVKDMSLCGIPPRQIISSLRQETPDLPVNSRNIYNWNAKFRKDELGKKWITTLFDELAKSGFLHDVQHNPQGRITHLFIAHPLSIKLAKLFSNIFVMDCTYKTNRFNMPLLHIIGVSCFNTSFYSGFAFLQKEDKDSYAWALTTFKKFLGDENQPYVIITDRELALINAIKDVFPSATSLLCVWHINKNVFSNCKTHFVIAEEFDIFMEDWNNLVYSTSEAAYVKSLAEFELLYNDKKDVIKYIRDTWSPWKEKFVSAWTEIHLHLGNRASSRAEGAHAKLKMYLQASTGGFQEVKKKISQAVEHEFNEIKIRLAREKLTEIHKQCEKSKGGTMTPCTDHFMATMGLPCAHKIKDWNQMALSLELIHPHWRINTLSLNREDCLENDGELNLISCSKS
ncbi:PKS-NRPS hybrid synthetase [Tanacetum coccineum]